MLGLPAALLLPAQTPCDPHLIQSPANPYGYRLRGDRCEGIYAREVGGAPLAVVSWTEAFENYDPASGAPLLIEWEAPSKEGVRLRAQSLRRRLYYRMDAVRSPGSTSFSWKPDLLAAIGIPRSELGILGSIQGADGEVYLPLRVAQKHTQRRPGTYELVVVPGVELQELFITIAGNGAVVKDGEALGHGYYPAERPLTIPIGGLPRPGTYRLEIGATLRRGGSSTAELWFYHPRK